MTFLSPLHLDSSCRGTQHFTGTVSNEATSEMGYPAWPAGRTANFVFSVNGNRLSQEPEWSSSCTDSAIWIWAIIFSTGLSFSSISEPSAGLWVGNLWIGLHSPPSDFPAWLFWWILRWGLPYFLVFFGYACTGFSSQPIRWWIYFLSSVCGVQSVECGVSSAKLECGVPSVKCEV